MLLTRVNIQDSERQLVSRFTAGLRQQIQHTINLFNPLTFSEAHQQAITTETHTKNIFFWSATRPSRSPAQTPATDTVDTPKNDTAIVPVADKNNPRPSSVRCFSCGEIGHRVASCPTRNRRGLLLDVAGNDVEAIYDEEPAGAQEETEILTADTGAALMLRRVCLAPRVADENPQRKNLFIQSAQSKERFANL